MAGPTRYSDEELELIDLMWREVGRLRAKQKTRALSPEDMDTLVLLARTNGDLQAWRDTVK